MGVLIQAAQLLEKAAALIEERGWCQGRGVNFEGNLCVYGALAVAMGDDPADNSRPGWSGAKASELNVTLTEALLRVIHPSGTDFNVHADPGAASRVSAIWNDSKNQTASTVVATMRHAADQLYERSYQ